MRIGERATGVRKWPATLLAVLLGTATPGFASEPPSSSKVEPSRSESTSAAHAESESPELIIDGMTFVSSRDDANEVVLESDRAIYRSDDDWVELEGVRAEVTRSKDFAFDVRCRSGELDLKTNDFIARGNVTGRTESGQEFTTDWVRYEHDEGVLYTTEAVVIREGTGTYRGGGFRYLVRERRFKLLEGASVVHTP